MRRGWFWCHTQRCLVSLGGRWHISVLKKPPKAKSQHLCVTRITGGEEQRRPPQEEHVFSIFLPLPKHFQRTLWRSWTQTSAQLYLNPWEAQFAGTSTRPHAAAWQIVRQNIFRENKETGSKKWKTGLWFWGWTKISWICHGIGTKRCSVDINIKQQLVYLHDCKQTCFMSACLGASSSQISYHPTPPSLQTNTLTKWKLYLEILGGGFASNHQTVFCTPEPGNDWSKCLSVSDHRPASCNYIHSCAMTITLDGTEFIRRLFGSMAVDSSKLCVLCWLTGHGSSKSNIPDFLGFTLNYNLTCISAIWDVSVFTEVDALLTSWCVGILVILSIPDL